MRRLASTAALCFASVAHAGPPAGVDVVREAEARIDDLRATPRDETPAAPVDEATFGALVFEMHAAPFVAERRDVLRAAVAGRWFTSAQVARVLDAFPFSSDQVEAVRLLVPRLTDPENAFRLFGAFPFEADRAAVRALLEARRPAP